MAARNVLDGAYKDAFSANQVGGGEQKQLESVENRRGLRDVGKARGKGSLGSGNVFQKERGGKEGGGDDYFFEAAFFLAVAMLALVVMSVAAAVAAVFMLMFFVVMFVIVFVIVAVTTHFCSS